MAYELNINAEGEDKTNYGPSMYKEMLQTPVIALDTPGPRYQMREEDFVYIWIMRHYARIERLARFTLDTDRPNMMEIFQVGLTLYATQPGAVETRDN